MLDDKDSSNPLPINYTLPYRIQIFKYSNLSSFSSVYSFHLWLFFCFLAIFCASSHLMFVNVCTFFFLFFYVALNKYDKVNYMSAEILPYCNPYDATITWQCTYESCWTMQMRCYQGTRHFLGNYKVKTQNHVYTSSKTP